MEFFDYPKSEPVWFSLENPQGKRNNGGKANFGAKGRAFESLKNGEEKVLCDTDGPGVIRRIWFTLCDRSEQALKNTRLRMYWDNQETPAVDVSVGDFFCMGHGKMSAFENALFSSPEGRSFHCTIPMPFLKHARITMVNLTGEDNPHLFYDIDMTRESLPENILYFHTLQTITERAELEKEVEILPKVYGTGRFLGTSLAIEVNGDYGKSWWGEGEVKVYFGDDEYPTLNGTGAEDYIGTAWGQETFVNRTQGCILNEDNQVSLYRFHLEDEICFYDGIRVTIQDMGGCCKTDVQRLQEEGVPLVPVSADLGGTLLPLYKKDTSEWEKVPEAAYVNFFRQDGFRATAYFYLNRP